jgi:hypothetical protein
MKTTNETSRKKIGFKSYDEEETNKNVPSTVGNNEEGQHKEVALPMSPAQADLLETIQSLSEMIVSEEFSKFAQNQRAIFVLQLMNSVALNSELTTKTLLLLV